MSNFNSFQWVMSSSVLILSTILLTLTINLFQCFKFRCSILYKNIDDINFFQMYIIMSYKVLIYSRDILWCIKHLMLSQEKKVNFNCFTVHRSPHSLFIIHRSPFTLFTVHPVHRSPFTTVHPVHRSPPFTLFTVHHSPFTTVHVHWMEIHWFEKEVGGEKPLVTLDMISSILFSEWLHCTL
jgi:hypothetical protein